MTKGSANAQPAVESFWGLRLVLECATEREPEKPPEQPPQFQGLQYVGDIMRLHGLEVLFGCAQLQDLDWTGLNYLRSSIDHAQYKEYAPAAGLDADALRASGERWLARAARMIKQSGGSGVANQWDEARECFLEAAKNFVLAEDLDRAGKAYSDASECATKLRSILESAADLTNAAACFRHSAPLDSVACLQAVIDIFVEQGRTRKVAKFEKQIGQIYEELWQVGRSAVDLEKSALHYLKASEFYQGEQYLSERNVCLSKVAAFNGLAGRYADAIAKFEEVNKRLTGEKIKAEGLFRAMLCYLVDITVDNRLPGIEKAVAAFEFYSDTEPQFQSGKEYDLIRGLIDDIKRQDLDKFYRDQKAYLALRPGEYWRDHMLDLIEKHLVEVLDSVDKMVVVPGAVSPLA